MLDRAHPGRRVPMLLVSMLAACSSRVATGDAAPADAIADGATADAIADATFDVTATQCMNVRECAPRPPPTGEIFGVNWSCVLGTCDYEPQGSRTCYPQSNGCFQCDAMGVQSCPGAPCLASLDPAAVRFESSNCSRDFLASVVACRGPFVELNDGTTCILTQAPTDAIRYVLSCGPCETVFTPR